VNILIHNSAKLRIRSDVLALPEHVQFLVYWLFNILPWVNYKSSASVVW